MADAAERNAGVFQLLAKSRWARDGAAIAAENGDDAKYAQLCEKSARLEKEADAVDPGHECAAWADHLRGTN